MTWGFEPETAADTLAQAWWDRAAAARVIFEAAEKAPGLVKPKEMERVAFEHDRSVSMAKFWEVQR